MKRIVFLTGAGMSAESGLSTFRDSDGLWNNYPVQRVATHEAWLQDPDFVNAFYNERRRELIGKEPNDGHRAIAALQEQFDVRVITQNVDNLHERAGSNVVLHLHGELMKTCSSRDVDNPRYWRTMTAEQPDVMPGEKAADGSLLRPYIVFFGEAVPNISLAADWVAEADILVIIGTSLAVYPAAGLIDYVRPGTPIYLIDPKPIETHSMHRVTQLQTGGSEGMRQLRETLSHQQEV